MMDGEPGAHPVRPRVGVHRTNSIVAWAIAKGVEPVIPARSHRKEPWDYEQDLYRLYHLVKNAFLKFEQWRAVSARYRKRSASFLGICQIRALVLWAMPVGPRRGTPSCDPSIGRADHHAAASSDELALTMTGFSPACY